MNVNWCTRTKAWEHPNRLASMIGLRFGAEVDTAVLRRRFRSSAAFRIMWLAAEIFVEKGLFLAIARPSHQKARRPCPQLRLRPFRFGCWIGSGGLFGSAFRASQDPSDAQRNHRGVLSPPILQPCSILN